MRCAALLLVSAILGLGCSSDSGEKPEEDFPKRLTTLARERPKDPSVLLLAASRSEKDIWLWLVSLEPTPPILAGATQALLSSGGDEWDGRGDLEDVLSQWRRVEPDNALPLIVRGCLAARARDLDRALALWEAAGHKPYLKTHTLELRRAMARTLREEDLDSAPALVRVLTVDTLPASSMLDMLRILSSLAYEHRLRGQQGRAFALLSIPARFGFMLGRSAETSLQGQIATVLEDWTTYDLCQLGLARSDKTDASRWADRCRAAGRLLATLRIAHVREKKVNPLVGMKSDLGVGKSFGRLLRAAVMAELGKEPEKFEREFARGVEEFREKEREWQKRLAEREALVRPYAEKIIREGELKVLLDLLTEEDHKAVKSKKFLIDQFMDKREEFYPDKDSPKHRETLLAYLGTKDDDLDMETYEYFQSAAFYALLHHAKKGDIPRLRKLRERGASSFVTYALAGLGDTSDEVLSELANEFEEGPLAFTEVYWALSRLGRKEFVRRFVGVLEENQKSRASISEVIPVTYALKDLTGQDFGFDPERWRAWVAQHPDEFK